MTTPDGIQCSKLDKNAKVVKNKASLIIIDERAYDISVTLYDTGDLNIRTEDKITKLLYETRKSSNEIDAITTSHILTMNPETFYNIIIDSLAGVDNNVKLTGAIVSDKCVLTISWKILISSVEFNKTLNLELDQIPQSDVDRMSRMMISYDKRTSESDSNVDSLKKKLEASLTDIEKLKADIKGALLILQDKIIAVNKDTGDIISRFNESTPNFADKKDINTVNSSIGAVLVRLSDLEKKYIELKTVAPVATPAAP